MKNIKKPSRKFATLKSLIAIILSVIGLAWAFHDFNYVNFKQSLSEAQLIFILFAAILLASSVWIRAQRWQWLINVDIKPTVNSLFKIEMIGYFANNVFPLRAGELLRAYLLKKKYNIKASFGLGTIVMERLSDTIGLLILGIILLTVYPLTKEMQKWVITSAVAAVMAFIAIIIFIKFSNKMKNSVGWKGVLSGFIQGLSGFEKDKLLKICLFTGIIWGVYWFNTHIVQHALNLNLTVMESLLVLIITSLSMSIPSAPGMVGTYHAAVKFTMVQILGHDPDFANSFSIILHAYGFICLTLIGAFYYISVNLEN